MIAEQKLAVSEMGTFSVPMDLKIFAARGMWSPESRPAGSLGQLRPSRHTPIDAWIQKMDVDGDVATRS
jgi:hypothetical protein